MSLSFVNISHIGYINPTHFSKIALSTRYRVCLHFAHIQYTSQKVPENVSQRYFHANIWARKAALVRNYFFRRINFCLKGPQLPSLSRSAIFGHINADLLFRRVNYLYLATFTCPIVFLYPVSTWMAVNGVLHALWDLLKRTHGQILTT